MKKVSVAIWADLHDRRPEYAIVGEVDLVVVRYDDVAAVFLWPLPSSRRAFVGWPCRSE